MTVIKDPRQLGCLCDTCPLNGKRPVLPDGPHPAAAWFTVVGDAPGEEEERHGVPLIGKSGKELFDRTLSPLGVPREQLHVTTALLCRPDGNRLRELLARVKADNIKIEKENVERRRGGLDPRPKLPTPMDCCSPRLYDELKDARKVLLSGATAADMVVGPKPSLTDIRGSLLEGSLHFLPTGRMRLLWITQVTEPRPPGPPLDVIATFHPSFIMREGNRKMTIAFQSDVSRAVHWFSGSLQLSEPAIRYQPRPSELLQFLYPNGFESADIPARTYDVETDDIEPLTASTRCIAIGNKDEVMVVGFISKNRTSTGELIHLYAPEDEALLRQIIAAWMADPRAIKFGHNAGYYDRLNAWGKHWSGAWMAPYMARRPKARVERTVTK